MKVAADLCIVPMGVGPSVSHYVREIKAIVEASGLSATMHANGTSIDGELVDICPLAERGEVALAAMGVQRTFFTLTSRPGATRSRRSPTRWRRCPDRRCAISTASPAARTPCAGSSLWP